MSGLPEAKLRPRDADDRLVILRGKAKDGARVVGRGAVVAGKTLGALLACGIGLAAVGAISQSGQRSKRIEIQPITIPKIEIPRIELDTARMERLNESLRAVERARWVDPPHTWHVEPATSPPRVKTSTSARGGAAGTSPRSKPASR